MNRHRPTTATSLLLATLAAGCGDSSAGYQLPLDEQQDEIINGTTPADGSQQALGVVQVTSNGGSCTGTLVSNQFVLTARHCVRQWNGTGWGNLFANLQVRSDGPGNVDQTVTSEAVSESNGNPTAGDYALIRLSRPVTINGPSDQLYNPIYAATDASLLNQTVFCVGYGHNVLASVGPPPTGQTGFGTLRTANLLISNTAGNVVTVTPNAANQIVTAGDSGSTCFFNGQLTGVQSGCTVNPSGPGGGWVDVNGDNQMQSNEFTAIASCVYASPGSYRLWANGIVLANVTVLPFTFSPTVSTAVNARLTTLSGTDTTVNAKSTTTVVSAAVRAGWIQVSVPSEPPATMCSVTRQVSPVTGTVSISGACLNDGLVANLVSRTL